MNKIIYNSDQKVRLIWRFSIFILVFVLIKALLNTILSIFLDTGLLYEVFARIIYFISVILSLFFQIKYIDKTSFEKYGLKIEQKWLQEFIIGAFIAIIQLSLFFIGMYFTNNLKIIDYFVTNSSEYTFIEGFFAELIRQLSASISEEIMFRSFLIYIIYEVFNRIGKIEKKNIILACIITSSLFGIVHLTNDGATIYSTINLSFDGMMICLPFLISGRLGMSIGMHFSWNIFQGAIYGFPNSGQIAKASILSSELQENIFTGGLFGPEGSILLLVLDILAVVFIIYWKKIMKYDNWVNPLFIKYG